MNDYADVSNSVKQMRPGVTVTDCQTGFELVDMSEVELEISDFFNFEKETKVLFVIDPESLEYKE